MEKIYIRNFKKTRKSTINDILKLFLESNYKKADGGTYYDKECIIDLQCEKSKTRSFTDIIQIVRTYFPNSKYQTIFKKLYELITDYNLNKINNYEYYKDEDECLKLITIIYCDDIENFVIQRTWNFDLYEIENNNIIFNCIYDYNDLLNEFYDNNYNEYNLLDFLNINNLDVDEFEDFLIK